MRKIIIIIFIIINKTTQEFMKRDKDYLQHARNRKEIEIMKFEQKLFEKRYHRIYEIWRTL